MEQPIATANGIVLQYNMVLGQWIELGSENGTCNINLLKSITNEYRFVAMKESNKEVVLNSFLFPSMKYDKSTGTFHQWYDENKLAFGINFNNLNEAKKFGLAADNALEKLYEACESKSSGESYKIHKKSVDLSRKSSEASPYAISGINMQNMISTLKELNIPPTNTAGPIQTSSKRSLSTISPPDSQQTASPLSDVLSSKPPNSVTDSAVSRNSPINDFASQLKAATGKRNKYVTSIHIRTSDEAPSLYTEPCPSPDLSTSSGPIDFLSELKMISKSRTSDPSNSFRKTSVPPVPNIPPKTNIQESKKISDHSSDSPLVTQNDLELFRIKLMDDILSNLEKMKNELILSMSSMYN